MRKPLTNPERVEPVASVPSTLLTLALSQLKGTNGLRRKEAKEIEDMPDDKRYITTSHIVSLAHKKGIKISNVTVMAKCRTLGIPKTAGIFLLTTQEAEHVLSQLRGKPGRPPGPQPWIQEGISRANWYWRHNTELKQKKRKLAQAKKSKAAKRKPRT